MSELVAFARKQLEESSKGNYEDDVVVDELFALIGKEFPKYLIEVSLDYEQLVKLDEKLPFTAVYFEDDRFPQLIRITKENPTFRDIIKQMNSTYTPDIIEDHRFLERIYIKYISAHFCIVEGSWGS